MSNTSYWLYQRYVKYGNSEYVPVFPAEYAISGDTGQDPVLKQDNDPNCGYCETEYRWHALPIGEDYVCSGGNKYYKEVYQVSNDCGFNWENVVPESARTGNLYESGSSDCVEYRWTNIPITDDYICDECPDFSELYLTFIPTSGSSTFKFNQTDSATTVYYSLDSGSTWTALSSNVYTPSVAEGQKIMWKSSGLTPSSSNGIGRFSSTGQFEAEGNVMSLLYGDNFIGQTDLTGKNYAFKSLFNRCTTITSAEYLVLPATTLSDDCYADMFGECISLTTAPSILPATTLSYGCYASMFYDCTSLTTAPKLPATTLSFYCYNSMFQNCTSLVTAPALPATTLEYGCYESMFGGCTNLTKAPALPAETLADYCYMAMFFRCTSLTTAPELPAETLAEWCYYSMFQGCTNLNNITCLATDISASDCTTNWVYNVSSTGTFTKDSSMTSWETGKNGIPSNWTIQNV